MENSRKPHGGQYDTTIGGSFGSRERNATHPWAISLVHPHSSHRSTRATLRGAAELFPVRWPFFPGATRFRLARYVSAPDEIVRNLLIAIGVLLCSGRAARRAELCGFRAVGHARPHRLDDRVTSSPSTQCSRGSGSTTSSRPPPVSCGTTRRGGGRFSRRRDLPSYDRRRLQRRLTNEPAQSELEARSRPCDPPCAPPRKPYRDH
jgi:hypothetical protein